MKNQGSPMVQLDTTSSQSYAQPQKWTITIAWLLSARRPKPGAALLFFEDVLVYWLWHTKTTDKNDLVKKEVKNRSDGEKKDPFSWLKFIGE